jgi:hypothetical protein
MAWCEAGSCSGPSRGSAFALQINKSADCHNQVVDNVLKEPNQPDVVLYNRARVGLSSSGSGLCLVIVRIGLAPHRSHFQIDSTGRIRRRASGTREVCRISLPILRQ